MYQLLRKFYFNFDPERAHYMAMRNLQLFTKTRAGKNLVRSFTEPPLKETHFLNLKFKNPVGLGAGFDKNAVFLNELEALGFGFVEIGTVTPLAQEGNGKPRLFRLPADKALINRMGFNNDGAEQIARRLEAWREQTAGSKNPYPLIIGGNIGKNKNTPNENAWQDYAICFNKLHHFVDYFVVNVSSPNTPGLRELQDKEALRKILLNLEMINNGKAFAKPILLKIAPDLTQSQVDDVIALALEIKLDGLVVSNTTIDRSHLQTPVTTLTEIGAGGLSGKPLQSRSTALIRYITEQTNHQIPIIGSGGIFTGLDAREKLDAGASLVQIWTGFIYEGPTIVKNICKDL
ncbi:dihydroorotate dehydrogenase (quinone) [Niabella ginsenosidivorans]|uniref:Dihydroorotate dehydrogenase (quinone) n=1 Tax=Niabella ginsenosidivorans TaxID=1176587 RepID=A0A1A9I4M4_9BACT|nr:quinone-dependent dihydroorotate dehydrogenase [Niabella ginsenosidivorans]ANH81999.1 dihydroorotate dehydrogenase (quinone) [Niabella ginsenosidivorans]